MEHQEILEKTVWRFYTTSETIPAHLVTAVSYGEALLHLYRLFRLQGYPNKTLTDFVKDVCKKAIGYKGDTPAILYVNRGKGDLQRIDLGMTPEALLHGIESGTL